MQGLDQLLLCFYTIYFFFPKQFIKYFLTDFCCSCGKNAPAPADPCGLRRQFLPAFVSAQLAPRRAGWPAWTRRWWFQLRVSLGACRASHRARQLQLHGAVQEGLPGWDAASRARGPPCSGALPPTDLHIGWSKTSGSAPAWHHCGISAYPTPYNPVSPHRSQLFWTLVGEFAC